LKGLRLFLPYSRPHERRGRLFQAAASKSLEKGVEGVPHLGSAVLNWHKVCRELFSFDKNGYELPGEQIYSSVYKDRVLTIQVEKRIRKVRPEALLRVYLEGTGRSFALHVSLISLWGASGVKQRAENNVRYTMARLPL